MQESIDDYKKRLAGYSNEDLESIVNSIDRDNHLEKYKSVLSEIETRKIADKWNPEKSDDKSKYRTLARRFGALLIDGLIFLLLSLLVTSPFSMLEKMEKVRDFPNSVMPYLIKGALIQLVYVAYGIFFHWRFGATIGKMILGVKVVDYLNEGRITLKQSILRDIVPSTVILISSVEIIVFRNPLSTLASIASQINGTWSIVEILTAVFSAKRRAIHDIIAKTICIKTKTH